MSKPWRTLAIFLFTAALVFGAAVGDQLLAVGGEPSPEVQTYTELLMVAHENYGAEVSYRDLVYASIQGMLRTLDPHTSFLSPEAYDDMRQRQQGSFYGLGILVSKRSGQLTVISPIEGTPAWRLGLRAGDIISTIEGEATDIMSLDDAVTKLKGPKGTQVNVSIVRRGLDEPLRMAITRAEIPQNTVRYAYMMTDDTAYIRLTDFTRSSSSEMEEALEKLSADGMEKLILDLRGNGGGLLDQTVKISNLFVPQHTKIVETRGRISSSYQTFLAEDDIVPFGRPMVVLVDRGSASAAEILAGAIQDHDVGLIAGTPTWGKGLVQTVYNLSYGAGMALTTAKYYTPSGRLIQRDYSSFYDYYNYDPNGEEEASEDAGEGEDVATPEVQLDSPEFRTDLGRSVYGGGGITPDVTVELPNGPVELQGLFVNNAFFNYAVDFHSRHDIDSIGWTPPDDLLETFRQWLIAEQLATVEELDEVFAKEEARDFAKRQIHADIMNSAFGTEASHRVLAKGDPQIQAALGLFDEATQMLAQRREIKQGRPGRIPSIEPLEIDPDLLIDDGGDK